jgi:CubicO group peptidase (beta-lactamase class C family)
MKPASSISLSGALLLAACAIAALAAPDEDELGKAQGYPIGTALQVNDEGVRVGRSSNLETLLPHNTLAKADSPSTLKKVPVEPKFGYTSSFDGHSYSVDDYLQHQRVTGLLIIKDGEMQVERYQYDRKPTHRFLSQSMAKSITSLAIGFALDEGKIKSLDDKVAKYAPELAGYPYGETSIRNILRMSSGVKFSEDYSGNDDLSRFITIRQEKSLVAAAQAFGEREAKEGTRFHYATSETYLLALVLKGATGRTLSDYLDEKLWKPMGAESDAKWIVDTQSIEYSGSSFNAVLRDYGRLGMLLANDGMQSGKQILPKSYLLEATDWHKQPNTLAPCKAKPLDFLGFGYGYQFWILPGEKRRFALIGRFGQVIYVDPELKLVMVQTAVANDADALIWMESLDLWAGVVQKYQP